MLTELRIENFAIIHQLELNFSSGLITFTGETGAGKSIILDAIMALMGGRADPTFIRTGAERSNIEATFIIPEVDRRTILEMLEREDLLEDSNILMMSRELRREGRTVARVNGHSVNINLLKELGSYLVDIHGQSEHLSLLNVRQHLRLLDRYADSEKLLYEYRQIYHRLQNLHRELSNLRQMEEDASRRAELLAFQAGEIEAAHLKASEDEELRQERERLANAENLTTLVQQSLLLLDEGAQDAPSISDQVGQLVQSLASLSRIDASQSTLANQAATFEDAVNEIIRELQHYLENIEHNPQRLEQVEERLDLIHNLKRKYGGSIESALAYASDARQKLDTIAHAGERIVELEEEEKALLELLAQKGQQLSEWRSNAAKTLAGAVENELADLNMAGARFSVDIACRPSQDGVPIAGGQRVAFDENGLDNVEFMIAPNPGEGLKPLVKIASGGETSRLMLALKNVLVRADSIPTLIFDEIDQGIGGRTGMIVGEKLWQLARRHQVFCVTHLPQLAAFGDQHFRVLKQVIEGRTITQVEKLDGDTRLDELAQMLGNLSEANRGAAQETLSLAQQRAAELVKNGTA